MDIEKQINQDMEREITQSLTTPNLTENEVAMFEEIRSMEAVHNEIGFKLGAYRDHIIETRNKFMKVLTEKYRIEKPSLMRYDPISQRLVSVFDDSVRASKIVNRPHAFTQLASNLVMDAIGKLKSAWKASGGK